MTLGEFEGRPVLAATVKITKAGDGLSAPLAAEPRAFHSGDRIPVLLWCVVDDINHVPMKETKGWTRVHEFVADEAVILDHVAQADLDALFEDQREKVRLWDVEQSRLKDEARGILRLDVDPEQDEDEAEAAPEIDDESWEASAREGVVSPIGSKRATKGKG